MLLRRRALWVCSLLSAITFLAGCSTPGIVQTPTTATQSAAAPATSSGGPSPLSTPAQVATRLPTLVPTALLPTATAKQALAPLVTTMPSSAAPATPIPPTPTSKPTGTPKARAGQPTAAGEKIFYLDPDGHTIRTIRPDGSNIQDVISIRKRPNEIVENLVGDPTGTYLLFSLSVEADQGARYFLVQNGRAHLIRAFTRPPRWSPDGHHFVAEVTSSSNIYGSIYLSDAATGTGRLLPAQGVPDWFPDGKHLVYAADDIFTFDLATNTTKQLTHLPDQGDETWGIQEAHVLPDGKNILFYGGQRKNVGASGNGQQWWTIPVAGGTPVPFSEPGGNGILAFMASPAGDALAYAESAHASACLSQQQVTVTGAGPSRGNVMNVPFPSSMPQSETASVFVQGLTWAPNSARIAYALRPYSCPDAGMRPRLAAPAIYIWNVRPTAGSSAARPRKLVNGSYPVWIR